MFKINEQVAQIDHSCVKHFLMYEVQMDVFEP